MQAFQAQGLKVLEMPTHAEKGMSLEALELALEQWPVKVIQLTPTCNSPLGYTMPVEKQTTSTRIGQAIRLTDYRRRHLR